MGLLEEESAGGVRLILEQPVEPGALMRWDVPGTTIAGSGLVIFSRALESPIHTYYLVGVERLRDEPRFADIRRTTAEMDAGR